MSDSLIQFEELERLRKRARAFFLLSIISFIGGGIIVYFMLALERGFGFVFIGVAVLLIALALLSISMKIQSYIRKDFKQKYIVPYVKENYPTIEYFPDQGLPKQYVNDLHLYQRPDRYKSEDFFMGTIEGVNFYSSDVLMEERHETHDSHGTHTYYTTYFKGRIAVFEFNKNFQDTIVVTEGNTKKPEGSKKVELESMEFNKKFKTYCTNDINAFYVLTPEIILSLLEVEQENPGKLAFMFENNRLTICINNNIDTFEINLNKKIDYKFLDTINKDISLFQRLIYELKLNKNIFKEED